MPVQTSFLQSLGAESDLYQYWYGNEWIDNWLRQIVPLSGSEQEKVFTYVGYYFQLLKVLLGSNVFEEIEIPGRRERRI